MTTPHSNYHVVSDSLCSSRLKHHNPTHKSDDESISFRDAFEFFQKKIDTERDSRIQLPPSHISAHITKQGFNEKLDRVLDAYEVFCTKFLMKLDSRIQAFESKLTHLSHNPPIFVEYPEDTQVTTETFKEDVQPTHPNSYLITVSQKIEEEKPLKDSYDFNRPPIFDEFTEEGILLHKAPTVCKYLNTFVSFKLQPCQVTCRLGAQIIRNISAAYKLPILTEPSFKSILKGHNVKERQKELQNNDSNSFNASYTFKETYKFCKSSVFEDTIFIDNSQENVGTFRFGEHQEVTTIVVHNLPTTTDHSPKMIGPKMTEQRKKMLMQAEDCA